MEKVQSNRSEECFDSKPKLDSWPEPSRLVPAERLRRDRKHEDDLQHIPAGRVERQKFPSQSLSLSADNLLDVFPRKKKSCETKMPMNLDFDPVLNISALVGTTGFIFHFQYFSLTDPEKKRNCLWISAITNCRWAQPVPGVTQILEWWSRPQIWAPDQGRPVKFQKPRRLKSRWRMARELSVGLKQSLKMGEKQNLSLKIIN